jgi:malonyl-CoA/methylmalonyl-CoA synthetase
VVGVLVVDRDVFDLKNIEHSVIEQLAKFKHPRKLVVVDALPRNTKGKVQKNLLRDQYKELFVA